MNKTSTIGATACQVLFVAREQREPCAMRPEATEHAQRQPVLGEGDDDYGLAEHERRRVAMITSGVEARRLSESAL